MIINGNLYLYSSSIESLGNLKEVNGNLWLNGTLISIFPKDFKFKNKMGLDISYTKIINVDFLENKTFQFLNLNGLSFSKLPNGLRILENLNLCDCENLKELPKDLKVGEEIFLKGSSVTKKYILKERPDLIKQCDWLF